MAARDTSANGTVTLASFASPPSAVVATTGSGKEIRATLGANGAFSIVLPKGERYALTYPLVSGQQHSLRRQDPQHRLIQRRNQFDRRRPAGVILQFGDVRLDVDRRLVSVSGEEVHLTPIEYELFKELALSGGRVLTHRLLLNRVWGAQYENEVNYLRPVITSLRKKLGTHLIKTEPAVGYRLQE